MLRHRAAKLRLSRPPGAGEALQHGQIPGDEVEARLRHAQVNLAALRKIQNAPGEIGKQALAEKHGIKLVALGVRTFRQATVLPGYLLYLEQRQQPRQGGKK